MSKINCYVILATNNFGIFMDLYHWRSVSDIVEMSDLIRENFTILSFQRVLRSRMILESL